jgi:hypothetical protein
VNVEYEIYVPLTDNDGIKYPTQVLQLFKDDLVNRFSGLTDLRFRSEGVWRFGGIEFRDEIVLWKVITSESADVDEYFVHLKDNMSLRLRQKTILILKRHILVL